MLCCIGESVDSLCRDGADTDIPFNQIKQLRTPKRCSYNGRLYVWLSTEGMLDLCNGVVSEKTPQIFWPLLLAEYVTVFSGRTDTPEVRCDLTDTHTQTNHSNPPVHAHRGIKNDMRNPKIHVCRERLHMALPLSLVSLHIYSSYVLIFGSAIPTSFTIFTLVSISISMYNLASLNEPHCCLCACVHS